MRTWCGRAKDAGAELVDDEGLIVNTHLMMKDLQLAVNLAENLHKIY